MAPAPAEARRTGLCRDVATQLISNVFTVIESAIGRPEGAPRAGRCWIRRLAVFMPWIYAFGKFNSTPTPSGS
jgi:hypothetical protein